MADALEQTSPLTVWAGRTMSGIVVLFLILDGGVRLVPIAPVTDTLRALGWPDGVMLARTLGILTLGCTLLYAIPRTAILLTGYLGGSIATHLRVGSPLFTHLFFGLYLGLLASRRAAACPDPAAAPTSQGTLSRAGARATCRASRALP